APHLFTHDRRGSRDAVPTQLAMCSRYDERKPAQRVYDDLRDQCPDSQHAHPAPERIVWKDWTIAQLRQQRKASYSYCVTARQQVDLCRRDASRALDLAVIDRERILK